MCVRVVGGVNVEFWGCESGESGGGGCWVCDGGERVRVVSQGGECMRVVGVECVAGEVA